MVYIKLSLLLFSLQYIVGNQFPDELPTLYEYYTSGGIENDLQANGEQFLLNGRNISIYSAAMHYFRVPKQYWRDRLRKIRAAGLNAVETYVSWNLHEPQPGQFDFGDGGSDMQDFLNITEFLTIAQEEDLFTIVRPGPFICAEWEFGGMPSWLLRSDNINFRSSDPKFMTPVKRYFNTLIPMLAKHQFTNGGSIIVMQVENEYWGMKQIEQIDKEYLLELKNLTINNGYTGYLMTSDTIALVRNINVLPGVLQTANFADRATFNLGLLRRRQPGLPIMSMEFWTGWYDHWTEEHHTRTADEFGFVLENILKFPASVNMYMFHGGTNFGFLNGANMIGWLQPTTTSYDYDAPLSETGDYTDKYEKVVELMDKYNQVKLRKPSRPQETKRIGLPTISVTSRMDFADITDQALYKVKSKTLLPMEHLPINNNSGQSYGYIVYRKHNISIESNSTLKIEGKVCDTVMVLINGKLISKPLESEADLNGFGYWRLKNSKLHLGDIELENATLELVVENWGRNNFAIINKEFNQKKGIWQGNVLINDNIIEDWEIIPLQFRTQWINNLQQWSDFQQKGVTGPALYKGTFDVDKPIDTFIDMRKWNKGFIAVNGFVIGRYCSLGPQYTLYIPAPILKTGTNEIVIFEHFTPNNTIEFSAEHIFVK